MGKYRTRPLRRAFTLIEVLTVVTIMALAGAIVVPSLLRPSTLSVEAASRQVIADMLVAQNEAIASQAMRQVIFDTVGNQYQLADENGLLLDASWLGGGGAGNNYARNFATDDRFQGVTMQNANFNGTAALQFDALGAPINGGTIDLIGFNTQYRITVASFTGRVTVAAF